MTMTKTQLGRLTFDNCVMNAAGIRCATTDDLDKIVASAAGSFVTKSATMAPRAGNPEPRMKAFASGSINAMGLPNHGLAYYLDYVVAQQRAHPDQSHFLSIAGTSPAENLQMLDRIAESAFTGPIELNLSCPNVPGHPQTAYDFEAVDRLLAAAYPRVTQPLGVKLPPYLDRVHFDQIARILNQYPVAFVTTINSLGNGLVIDREQEQAVIKPNEGLGGIGGSIIKPTALANVAALHRRLRADIPIIGVGGITSGGDVFDHILCGAAMVQIGTQFGFEGPAIFARLTQELETIMTNKGYQSLNDFKGRLALL